ncbi:acetoacetate decarboxylase family protein [Streptomyces sp. NPDC047525]|uniref:acetoacetate decarboxylase family protein n=1 Tax=Streptomyces sp. NPDC047525 TaxID=3155264 RepID=UPI00340498BB
MSLVLPNTFACTTRTALLDGAVPTDFSHLAQHSLPELVRQQLTSVRRFLVSVSRVRSSVTADRSIDFTETLIKIPVRFGQENYLFPVVTYVDHEYSLIRGFLLGFHKLFAAEAHDPVLPMVTLPGVDLDLRDEGPEAQTAHALPPEQGWPFLLWTDYAVSDARSRGWRTLEVEQYARTQLTFLQCARSEQVIGGEKATVRGLYEATDEFVVVGTRALSASSLK